MCPILFISIELCFNTIDTVGTGAAEIGLFPIRISAVPSTTLICWCSSSVLPLRCWDTIAINPRQLGSKISPRRHSLLCCQCRNANHKTVLSIHHITSDQQSYRCGLLIRTNQRGITSICEPSLTIRGQTWICIDVSGCLWRQVTASLLFAVTAED